MTLSTLEQAASRLPQGFTLARENAGAGWGDPDPRAFWRVFLATARAVRDGAPALRQALEPQPDWRALCAQAAALDPPDERAVARFIAEAFVLWRIEGPAPAPGFCTGYYEPLVEGALAPSPAFSAALYARPDDLDARRPYPTRADIEAGAVALKPLLYVRDRVEAFLIHVQGSASVRLADGTLLRLTYAGRNGRPYTSIGRILVESGAIALADMSLDRLKAWVRAHGQSAGEPGGALLARNESFIFFALDAGAARARGPIGGAGVALTPLRSVAVDRAIWPYGLPFRLAAQTSAPGFDRWLVAQDTGSAIVGPARFDLFLGSGDEAGRLAGDLRATVGTHVLLPSAE